MLAPAHDPAKIRSGKYRQAAAGQPCTLNILGVCTHDPATTVLAHLPGERKGTGAKVDDLNAVDACHACHAVIDGPSTAWPPGEYAHREWYLRRALARTIRNRVLRGILTLEDFAS